MKNFLLFSLAIFLIIFCKDGRTSDAIPVNELFKDVNIVSMSLSPKGDYVLEISRNSDNKILNLIETNNFKKYQISKESIYESTSVTNYTWLNNDTLYVKEEDGAYIITIDSSESPIKVEWHQIPVGGYILSKKIDNQGNIIFAKNTGDYGQYYRLYQLSIEELLNGDLSYFQTYSVNLSDAVSFYLDDKTDTLIGHTFENDKIQIWYLPPDKIFWSRLYQHEIKDKFIPVAFINKDSLAVLTNKNSNFTYLAEFSLKSQSFTKVLYKHPTTDLTYATLNRDGKVHSVNYVQLGTSHIEYLSPAIKSMQKKLSTKIIDRKVAIIETNDTGELSLIFAHASNTPGEMYLFDSRSNKLRSIGLIRKNLKGYELAKAEVFNVIVNDKLTLEGIVTKPSVPSNGVLLVNPHGGPIGVRDNASFNLSHQFYASRGYTILNVNFRGSTGFGKSFEDQGRGQFGELIEQDIMSVYNHFIKKNKFNYTCAMGSSYGGYSAIMLAIKHPGIFQCAISVFGIFDLPHLFSASNRSITPENHDAIKRVMGDDMAKLSAISPIKMADKLQVPVLIMAGRKDVVAPFEQSNRMKYTLKKLGKTVEFHDYDGTGHGHPDWVGNRHQHKTIHQFIQNTRGDFYRILQAYEQSDIHLVKSLLKSLNDINIKDSNGFSLLHYAVRLEDERFSRYVARVLLENGIDIEIQDDYLRTPLILATTMKREKLVTLFLNKGANVLAQDNNRLTPLFIASDYGFIEISQLILNKTNNTENRTYNGLTALMIASYNGRLEIVKLLIEHGADVHAVNNKQKYKTPLDYAKERKHSDIINYLTPIVESSTSPAEAFKSLIKNIKNNNVVGALKDIPLLPQANAFGSKGRTAAHYAIKLKSEDAAISVLKALIEQGVDINYQDKYKRSPIYMAIRLKRTKIIEFLLQNDADINQKGYKGWTPLMAAISRGQLESVKAMSAYPFDLTVISSSAGWPIFTYITNTKHKAKDKDQAAIGKILIEKGADIEVRSRSGKTALMLAAENGKFHVAKMLIEADADINAVNEIDENKTPLDYAIQDGHDEIAKYLRNVLHWQKNN